MVDLTQPVEGDNIFSLSSNSDETVDWSQLVRGDLGRPTSLVPTHTTIPVWDRVTWQ